jgi:hypothetical protein
VLATQNEGCAQESIKVHMVMVIDFASNNSQYLLDWLKTHWVSVKIKVFDTFDTIAHV